MSVLGAGAVGCGVLVARWMGDEGLHEQQVELLLVVAPWWCLCPLE